MANSIAIPYTKFNSETSKVCSRVNIISTVASISGHRKLSDMGVKILEKRGGGKDHES